MPEQRKKITLLGREVDVADVPIKSAAEPFSMYELEDGTTLRVKSVATSFVRVENEYNADGTPVYLVTTSPVVFIESSTLSRKR